MSDALPFDGESVIGAIFGRGSEGICGEERNGAAALFHLVVVRGPQEDLRAMAQCLQERYPPSHLSHHIPLPLGNLVSHAPTPYPHCQVYVNHHYKFIWIKGHKVREHLN